MSTATDEMGTPSASDDAAIVNVPGHAHSAIAIDVISRTRPGRPITNLACAPRKSYLMALRSVPAGRTVG